MTELAFNVLSDDEIRKQYPAIIAGELDETILEDPSKSSPEAVCVFAHPEDMEGTTPPTVTSVADACTKAIWSAQRVLRGGSWNFLREQPLTDDEANESRLTIRAGVEAQHPRHRPLHQELFRIYRDCLEENWDGYDAAPIPPGAFKEAKKIISLLPLDLPLPEIEPESTGEITFEWYKNQRNLFVIGVGGKETITYAGLFGQHAKARGAEYFKDELPSVIIQNIKRLLN